MITYLKPYPAMKVSGVPWLEEVPKHWEVQPIGRIGQLFKGNGGNKGDEVSTGMPCVRYGDLYTKYEFFIRSTKAYVSEERAGKYTPIHYGDVLFAASGETFEDIGRSAVNLIESDARCGGDILVLRPDVDVIPEFLGYACDSPASRHQKACMGRGFTVIHIYGSQLKRLVVPLPSLPEQEAIVHFLDHVDRRIRLYIRTKQKLIKLLEEQKQAIIHRAVTRGLDPNVRLKPSGVEWLGDVPEHWEVRRLKHLAAFRSGDGITALQIEPVGAFPVFGANGLRGFTNRFTHDGYFVLIGRQGALCGNVNYATGKFFASEHAVVTTLRQGMHVFWFGELLRVMDLNQYSQSAAQPGLAVERIRNLYVPVPPGAEQGAIADGIRSETRPLYAVISRHSREIDLLREYRTRLIADVVTGKLDVREAAAQLPDETEYTDSPDDFEPDSVDEETVSDSFENSLEDTES